MTRYGKAWGFQDESIRYFVDCVADGMIPEVTGRDGLMVTAMIEATLCRWPRAAGRHRRSARPVAGC